jgi:hypothetical protein
MGAGAALLFPGRRSIVDAVSKRLATLLVASVLATTAAPLRGEATANLSSACPPGAEQSAVPVLVATKLLRTGTLGSVILKRRMYERILIRCSQRLDGAFVDPKALNGYIVIRDVFPGQQLSRPFFSGVLRTSVTTPVRVGSYAQLTVKVTPRARCTIRVGYGTEEKSLGAKTGGRITWRWKVGSNVPPGRWPIVVQCGASGNLRLTIRVIPK